MADAADKKYLILMARGRLKEVGWSVVMEGIGKRRGMEERREEGGER